MTPYYADDWLTVWLGDCREVMASMAAESVHCVVTSPPYWGLRDYGTATWTGSEEACDHLGPPGGGYAASTLSTLGNGMRESYPEELVERRRQQFRATCGKCGATRVDSQLGLEPTPEAYVESMVAVFREVRRVLRKDGTVWLNLGDSYATGAGAVGDRPGGGRQGDNWKGAMTSPNRMPLPGLKPKDLVGIPWRVAFALQADGWYLRSDIIWSKPNPMPESVTDRPTKAHEYVFLLSKSPRYYYDADAVREASTERPSGNAERFIAMNGERSRLNTHMGSSVPYEPNGSGRNLRSVWTIATQPYPGAHFATFPRALVEPCIKAGTSEKGVCPECGAPWVRETSISGSEPQRDNYHGNGNVPRHRGGVERAGGFYPTSQTTGWRPSCFHVLDPIPATVLDPFAGSGTTGLVAQSLSRRAVLIDLSADYLVQLMDRNRDIPLGLAVE